MVVRWGNQWSINDTWSTLLLWNQSEKCWLKAENNCAQKQGTQFLKAVFLQNLVFAAGRQASSDTNLADHFLAHGLPLKLDPCQISGASGWARAQHKTWMIVRKFWGSYFRIC